MGASDLAGVSILVVEDHDDFRDVLVDLLSLRGATVNAARGGVEALEILEMGLAPDVILCDLHMPGLDGCRFVARLREMAGFGHIPVLMLTADNSDAARKRALEAGFVACLLKPFPPRQLQSEILRVLRN